MMTGPDFSKRLAEVAEQSNGGAAAAATLGRWLATQQPFVNVTELRRFAELAPLALIVDSFRCDIPFGTGGRRGRVGIGPNRINPRTLALTVAGHCEFLRATTPNTQGGTVVVANDTRVFTDINAAHTFMGDDWSLLGTSSRSLALLACQIYAVYGFETYLTAPKDHEAYMPTPELSYATRELGAAGGLNVSASHNHPDDNGFKVYTPTGGQYCPPDDATLSRSVEEVQLDPEIERLIARYTGAAAEIPADVHRAYISMYADRSAAICTSSEPVRSGFPIVYTPLCGTGLANVGETLTETGYQVHVPLDQYPDGSFASIPLRSPNPEIPGVADPAIKFAATVGAELVLSTDPDADRLGVEVKQADGTWRHLTGNQIGAIIAYFLVADPDGPLLAGPLITTVATSRVLRAIAALGRGIELTDDLMIGFKFIGQLLDSMAASAPSGTADLVLASEESHGYLTTTSLRDKDAASGGYIVAHLHALMRSQGRTLWDYLMQVFGAAGVHIELGRSLVLLGADGAEKIKSVMRSVRSESLARLGSEPVLVRHDFLIDGTDGPLTEGERASRDVLELISEHYRIVVRASGTEAKLKYYFDYAEAPLAGSGVTDQAAVAARYAELEPVVRADCSAVYADLARRAGYELSERALELPDVMPVQEKAVQ
jgi:phosphoglucomutase